MHGRHALWLIASGILCAAMLAGCGDDDPVDPDAGLEDAGFEDGGPDDAGSPDAAPPDAHVAPDAGPEPECTTADDCAPGASVCGVATCNDGECGVEPAPAGTVCRAPSGACDVAEVCDGVSLDCPADAVVVAGTECRASAGACDVAEVCDGASAECPADAVAAAETECRAPSGPCDAAEVCDGASVECPADEVLPAETVCRAPAGPCDVAEVCDGASVECPADALAAAGTVCRAPVGGCDAAEVCDGASVECPAATNVPFPAGTVCRAVDNWCDVAEVCSGASLECPTDTEMVVASCQRPFTFYDLGRTVTATTIDLNGAGVVATVAPGSTVSLRVVGNWVDSNTQCAACYTQFYARMNGVVSLCLGDSLADVTFDRSTTFTAPTEPGVYYVQLTGAWSYTCDDTVTSAPTTFGPRTMATLIVQ